VYHINIILGIFKKQVRISDRKPLNMFTEKHKGIFHVSNHSPEKGADMLEKEILNIWYLNIYHNVLVHPA